VIPQGTQLLKQENGVIRNFTFSHTSEDGIIGLFDTKSGATAENAGPRHDGLYKYIQTENKKNKNIIGGIIVEFKGTWRYNDKKKYNYDPDNPSLWEILDF